MEDVIINANGNIDIKATLIEKVKNILETHFNHSLLRPDTGIQKELILDIEVNPFVREIFRQQILQQLTDAGIIIRSMTVEEKDFFDKYTLNILNSYK